MKNESRSNFEIEKNAKNLAYTFIIEQGLMDEFLKFCNKHKQTTSLAISKLPAKALIKELEKRCNVVIQ